MILTKDNIVLVDNEIIFFTIPDTHDGLQTFTYPFDIGGRLVQVIASTNHSLEGVKHLDRNLFVKKVDVERLAEEKIPDGFNRHTAIATRHIWIDGYNAKEGEFTFEDMRAAMEVAYNYPFQCIELQEADNFNLVMENYLNSLRPLSIPESIELDDEFNVVNVKWELKYL